MPQRKFHVTEALQTNHGVIHRMMESGPSPSVEELFGVDLPRPISYRNRSFNFVTVERFQTSDSPSISRPGALVEITPTISFKLLGDKTQTEGLVTQIDFADFALHPIYFKDWYSSALAIGSFIRPLAFSVHSGEHYQPKCDRENYSQYRLGDRGEVTGHARIAALAINATSEAVLSIGMDHLMPPQSSTPIQ